MIPSSNEMSNNRRDFHQFIKMLQIALLNAYNEKSSIPLTSQTKYLQALKVHNRYAKYGSDSRRNLPDGFG